MDKFFDDNEAQNIEKDYSLESNFAIDFYWRVVDDGSTLEGVLRAKNTLSWVAMGKLNNNKANLTTWLPFQIMKLRRIPPPGF